MLKQGKTTELVAAIQQIPDLPESLLVACLAFFLDKERSGGLRAEAQLCYISMLLGRVFSEPLAEHEVEHSTPSKEFVNPFYHRCLAGPSQWSLRFSLF